MTELGRYWNVRWLRLKYINNLRARHVSNHAFADGDVAVLPWCSDCGEPDHLAVILRVHRGAARTYADVRLVCKKGRRKTLGTLFLTKPLHEVPKEVLDKRTKWLRKG